jgi:hypothetical protein
VTEIAINRLRAHLRLPREAMREEARVNRAIDNALAHELESAIDRRSITVDGYLCIPRLQTQVVLRLGESDAALAASVSQAIADAISKAIRGASGIYYTSRAHLLADLVMSVMRADFQRAWAWSQLGLWQESGASSARSHANQVAQVLGREARHAVAVLSELARDGSSLTDLLHWVDARRWTEMAQAASRAHGSGLDPERVFRGEALSPQVLEIAARFVEQSSIARAVATSSRRRLSDQIAAAFAILVLIEVEPAAIRTASDSVYAVLHSIAIILQRSAERGMITTATEDWHAQSSVEERQQLERGTTSENEPVASVESQQVADHPAPLERGSNAANPRAGESLEQSRSEQEQNEQPALEVRRSAITRIGGLTYLINAIARLELPGQIIRDHRLSKRGLRWTLHQLGIALLAPDPADPALLAFAGLLPDASPPNRETEAPRDEELAAVEEYRAMLIEYLRRALGDRLQPADISDDALIDFVCRRRAKILGDPGWLEVHFAVDEASPEIRFAGLDLDPGWIPWLGVVVKFIYA